MKVQVCKRKETERMIKKGREGGEGGREGGRKGEEGGEGGRGARWWVIEQES